MQPARCCRWRQTCLFCVKGRAVPFLRRRFLCAEAAERLEEDDHRHVLSCKAALLQNEGFTEAQIQAVLDCNPRSDRLSLLLTVLKDHGIYGQSAGSLIASARSLLQGICTARFCQRVQILEEAGLSPALIKAAMLKPSRFFFLPSAPENVHKHISFLKELGLSSDQSCLILIRRAQLISVPLEEKLKQRCNFLSGLGFSKGGIIQMIRQYSPFFWVSDASLLQKLQFMEELKLDFKTSSGMQALGIWIRYPIFRLRAKLDLLQNLGILQEDALTLVQRQPSVLCLSPELLTQKLDFLLCTMKLDIKHILGNGSCIICSLENRVIPRFAIWQDLRAKGLLQGSRSGCSFLSLTDEKFAAAYKVDRNLQQLYAAQSRLFTLKANSC